MRRARRRRRWPVLPRAPSSRPASDPGGRATRSAGSGSRRPMPGRSENPQEQRMGRRCHRKDHHDTGGSNGVGWSRTAARPAAPAGSTSELGALESVHQARAREASLDGAHLVDERVTGANGTSPGVRRRCRRPSCSCGGADRVATRGQRGRVAGSAAACTPTTRTSGRTDLTAARRPASSPPPPVRHHDGAHVGHLLEDLQADGPLAGHDVGVVERVDQHRTGSSENAGPRPGPRRPSCPRTGPRRRSRGVACDLGHRRVLRHEHRRSAPEHRGREGDALGVVAGAGRDDARAPAPASESRAIRT